MTKPITWFGVVMAFFLYLTGVLAINDGQIVTGLCAVVAGLALQFAVLRLADRK